MSSLLARDFDNPWEWKRFMLLKWLSLNPEWRTEQQVRFDNPCDCDGVGVCLHGNVYNEKFECVEVNQRVIFDELQKKSKPKRSHND